MKISRNINPFSNLDSFVSSLKKQDAQYVRKTRVFQILMWIFATVYAAYFVIDPGSEFNLNLRIGGLCYSLSFIAFALIFNKLNKKFRLVDYGVPVTDMLKNAIKRYSLSSDKFLMLIVPFLLTDFATVLFSLDTEDGKTLTEHILWAQAILIPAILLGAGIGVTIWYFRKKPMRDAAVNLLKEIES